MKNSATMDIKVLFFASMRETLGKSEMNFTLPVDATCEDLKTELRKMFPVIDFERNRVSIAVNKTYVSPGTVLKAGDTVAFIPPISGGIVLITGTSSGIGYATVKDLAKETKFTIFAGVRTVEDANRLKTELIGQNVVPIILDVTSQTSITKAHETIVAYSKEHHLPLVGLVNNAGFGHGIVFEAYPLEEARKVFDVNVFGLMEVTQRFLPLLRESKGRIIMIGSFAGTHSFPLGSIYCATKFAVEALSDCLRRELRGCQVSVSLMEPGFVKSVLVDTSHIQSKQILLKHNVPIDDLAKPYPKYFDEKLQEKKRNRLQGRPSEPNVVTSAIQHALTAEQPNPRYLVANAGGVPTSIVHALLYVLPDSVVDFFYTF